MALISIKEHIDKAGVRPPSPVSWDARSTGTPGAPPDRIAAAAAIGVVLDAYREAVAAIGAAGERAMPPICHEFHQSLAALAEKLTPGASVEAIENVRIGVASQIDRWGENASRYFKEKTDEMREIVMVVASTAQSVGERDIRYAGQFGDLTGRLQKIARLENFASVRRSLVESATQLTACVAKMTEEGQRAMEQMQVQVEVYRCRLEEAEERASHDSLTGLSNRGGSENDLAARIRGKRPFSVILLDLNGFKQVNDSLGHAAGDDVLKQFAAELRAQFAPSNTVGRWGGDEFIAILEGHLDQALEYQDRIEHWSFGDYTITADNQIHRIKLCGSLGAVEWDGSESGRDLIARADRELYDAKARHPVPAV